jgi:hypothetical protein
LPIANPEFTVTVNVLVPVLPAVSVRVPGAKEYAMPVTVDPDRPIVPVKPFRLPSVRVVGPNAPCWMFSTVGVALTLKSVTITCNVRVAASVLVNDVSRLKYEYVPNNVTR